MLNLKNLNKNMKNNYNIKKNEYGFFQIDPTPTPDEIKKFYAEHFYSENYKFFNDSSFEVQSSDKEFFEGIWSDFYNNFIEINNKLENNGSLLDIGCGMGLAMQFFKKKGFNTFGFDPSEKAVEYCKKNGLEVIHAGLDGIDVFENKKFDVVTLFNVLEHLPDPKKTINQIREVLSDKGILMIDVPNDFNDFQIAANENLKLDEYWVNAPCHLNYFSKDSLVNLLESSGFKIKICQSSFPLEMFLLFGDNYIKDSKLGSLCHRKRVNFEKNLRNQGKEKTLKNFYRALADLNLGRHITIFCTKN
jgi:2-polyprenyl-3-methyl-5-hydroxy-6-metoxy-1,4-benzoquinol methylase